MLDTKTILISLLLFLLFPYFSASQNTPSPKVIVIGVDGMGAEGVKRTNTHHIDELLERGSYTMFANAIMPTKSAPNWASLLMGTTPDVHGVTGNGWRRGDVLPQTACEGEKGIHQTIFSQLKQHDPTIRIRVYHDWEGLGKLVETSACTEVVSTKNAKKTLKHTLEAIKKKDFDLLFVHFDHVDHALHFSGFLSKRYLKKVEKADTFIGSIVEELEIANFPEGYIVLVTADHGGNGRTHGGDTLGEIEIPFIVAGTGIPTGLLDEEEVMIYDTAPTIGAFFGVPVQACWKGRNVLEKRLND